MLELMERLIAFKYSCKLNHWTTDSYAKHLLFDRLQEDIDDLVDDIAEKYFMAKNKKSDLKDDILVSQHINRDLVKSVKDIISLVEKLASKGDLDQGIESLISAISENFSGKLALLTLN